MDVWKQLSVKLWLSGNSCSDALFWYLQTNMTKIANNIRFGKCSVVPDLYRLAFENKQRQGIDFIQIFPMYQIKQNDLILNLTSENRL